jgi:leucyl-tRNA synthetase
MMVLVNEIYKTDTLPREVWETLLLLLSPYAPHMAEELWQRAGNKASIANVKWPTYIEKLTIDNEIELVIQVNGKLRSKLNVNKDISKDEMIELALNDEKIKNWTDGKTIIKKIAVPGKLVNIVVK